MLPEVELACEVQAVLSEKLMVQVASPDTDLLETGVLDSLTAVQLLLHLEERFGFKVAMEEVEIEDLRSIRALGRLIGRQKAACAAV
ncbi:MAG TPA: acyl carrier protein [Verrucomicrobiae bacterium]|nr:acyl carrier protein [Verrucomicrobiae bacterium]